MHSAHCLETSSGVLLTVIFLPGGSAARAARRRYYPVFRPGEHYVEVPLPRWREDLPAALEDLRAHDAAARAMAERARALALRVPLRGANARRVTAGSVQSVLCT